MSNISVSSFIIAIPEIYLLAVAFIIFLFGIIKNIKDYNSKIVFFNKLSHISVLALVLSLFLIYTIGDTYVETMHGLFIISPIIYLFKFVIVLTTIFLLVLSRRFIISNGICDYEYIVLTLLMLFGNMTLVSSNDFMSLYVSLELATICIYCLMFLTKLDPKANEAGIKYLILGSIGTAFLLYGISLLYGWTGSTNFIVIKNYLQVHNSNWILIISLIMIIIGMGFKLSLVPFHMWTVYVYKGSNLAVTLLLSTISKMAILFALIRILWEPFFYISNQWQHIMQLLIFLSAILGFVALLYQSNLKSFIAYSSIANMSYILMAILTPNKIAILDILIYIVAYSLTLIGFVGVVMLLKKNNKQIESIHDLKGLYYMHPYLSFTLTVFLFSMAGLPITTGFFGKIMILYSAIKGEYYYMATILALLSVVGMYFYLKVVKTIYFEKPEKLEDYAVAQKGSLDINITLSLIVLFVLGFMLFINPLTTLLDHLIVIF